MPGWNVDVLRHEVGVHEGDKMMGLTVGISASGIMGGDGAIVGMLKSPVMIIDHFIAVILGRFAINV